jgi:hypothetical protein
MDESQIKSVVARLSRPHPSGGRVIERAALLADGGDFPEVMNWITAHAGKPDTNVVTAPSRGLHGSRLHGREIAGPSTPQRFVLPAGVVD